jgi:hypothetical protein
MTDPARFGHDRLGHLLSDQLLKVPRFQRSYSWTEENIEEFLTDLSKARNDHSSYFMGTIVLAEEHENPPWKLIVDGQQRLTTTAILIVAIRDRLIELGKIELANSINRDYLQRYDRKEEKEITRPILNATDLEIYTGHLDHLASPTQNSTISTCYKICKEYVDRVSPNKDNYEYLKRIIDQLESEVQVLLAVASGIPEAYVIFETLNDRGADLTTADLLKNYLLSNAGDYLTYVEDKWAAIQKEFEKSDDLVKFIRHEHAARHGKVKNRELYRNLQSSIGTGRNSVKDYLSNLETSLNIYQSLREPDDRYWSGISVDVKDSLLAFRRFGLESSTPLLMAAFNNWRIEDAAKLTNKVAAWSIRAMMAGRLGGGLAEERFCAAARAIATGEAKNQNDVKRIIDRLIPDDEEFKRSFLRFGSTTTTRAKYLLAMLNREQSRRAGTNLESLPDWSSKAISVEHIYAKSLKSEDFESENEYDKFEFSKNSIENLTLLERKINRKLDDKPTLEKLENYRESAFLITREIADRGEWSIAELELRAKHLAEIAVATWPK